MLTLDIHLQSEEEDEGRLQGTVGRPKAGNVQYFPPSSPTREFELTLQLESQGLHRGNDLDDSTALDCRTRSRPLGRCRVGSVGEDHAVKENEHEEKGRKARGSLRGWFRRLD